MRIRIAVSLLSTMFTVSAFSQMPPDDEPLLLPIVSNQAPGAHGSLWVTEVYVHNSGTAEATVNLEYCTQGFCLRGGIGVDAGRTLLLPNDRLLGHALSGQPGVVVYVPKAELPRVSLNLRVRDLSRQSLTWGTELPVVRRSQYYARPFRLINVPLDERFRQTLRVYSAKSINGALFRARILDTQTGSVLSTQEFRTELTFITYYEEIPAALQINDVAERFGLPRDNRTVIIEIEPVTPNALFWAFVSITNNETQHVTTITPN